MEKKKKKSTGVMREGIVLAQVNGIPWRRRRKAKRKKKKNFPFFKFTAFKQITLRFIDSSQIYRYTDHRQRGTVAEQSSFI